MPIRPSLLEERVYPDVIDVQFVPPDTQNVIDANRQDAIRIGDRDSRGLAAPPVEDRPTPLSCPWYRVLLNPEIVERIHEQPPVGRIHGRPLQVTVPSLIRAGITTRTPRD